MAVNSFWGNKNVLITGHTGFKGSWLALWLSEMGANVYGYALEPDTNPSIFDQLKLKDRINHSTGNICDFKNLKKYIDNIKIDFVFHLAAQSLVLRGYKDTLNTWNTNVMGTANLLEALRRSNHACVVIAITTDKVYKNNETSYAFRENDHLGGIDPYSASKSGTELVIDSYRSLFNQDNLPIRIASARAGNVIGGGDWCQNRLLPDIIRANINNIPIITRNPNAVRPWQHVLEPLSGYLHLAKKLKNSEKYASAYNFGPYSDDNRTVENVIQAALEICPGIYHENINSNAPYESGILKLTIDKANTELGWYPKWRFITAITKTIDWYQQVHNGANPIEITLNQIKSYTAA
jgi:CDP-glucose 4,6-dehydratase